jgi:drug/metabolite transporter (DMT)-like permease
MLAIVLALAAAVSYSASDYAAGLATRRASVVRVTFVTELTHTALLMCLIPLVSSQAPSLTALAWGALAGISGLAGAMALYLGFRHAAFSIASSISAVGSATFAVLAGLLFGERPSALSLVGIALALPAIAAVSASTGSAESGSAHPGPAHPGPAEPGPIEPGPIEPRAEQPDPGDTGGEAVRRRGRGLSGHSAGVIWGLIAGAGFGLYFISLNQAGSDTDAWPLAAAGVTALVTITIVAAVTRQLKPPPPGTRWLSAATGITAAAGTFTFFLATHRGLLAITAIITSLYPAGTILLARVLSGERLTTVRIAGLGLAAASVVLIAVGGVG